MDQKMLTILLIVIAIVAAAMLIWLASRKRRSDELRERFGPEYERTVREEGDRGRAEADLLARQKRVEALDIRPLPAAERDRYAQLWRTVQARFVDDPVGATAEADRLIGDVMAARDYPVGDFEQRAMDVSVDHPRVVENYREAHRIALASERNEATTEDLRLAMQHYRALFDELLETTPNQMEVRR